MKTFMGKNFLLTTDTAKELFHDYAENMPIIDYHCYINPKEIYEDRKFENITQVLTVSTRSTSQEMQLTERSSRSGQRLLKRQSETRCIIGVT